MQAYKTRIIAARESIEGKELELEPLRSVIESLEKARDTVLRHCLNIGYDVRD